MDLDFFTSFTKIISNSKKVFFRQIGLIFDNEKHFENLNHALFVSLFENLIVDNEKKINLH